MAHTITHSNTNIQMVLVTDDHIDLNHPKVLKLLQQLMEWAPMGDIRELNLIRIGGDPNAFNYLVENNTGNLIIATLTFDDAEDMDPLMTINLTPGWRLSVLSFGGSPRQCIIELRHMVGIVSLEVEFY